MQKAWMKLVKFGFRLLYQEMAWSYGLVSWLVSLGEWRAWGRAALPFVRGERVLEVGHGPGHLLVELAAAGKTAVGLDLSPQMGRQARRRLRKMGLEPRLVRGRVQDLPFADGAFATILSTFPTEYIVDPAALAAFRRVLGGDGRLVIVPAGQLSGRGPLRALIAWAFRVTGQRSDVFAPPDSGLRKAPEWQQLAERFAEAGFNLTFHRVERPRSEVIVIVAEL